MTVHYRDTSSSTLRAEPVTLRAAQMPGQAVSAPWTPLYRRFGKRVFDVTLCILSAPFVLFIVAALAFLVARDGGKPFYCQTRVGKGGRLYRMWKLRSMVVGANRKLEAHLADNPEARAEWNKDQKLKNDPRVTRFGALLRRSSMDELPQLWNVLKGDMSLVGPRPMMPSQTALYPGRDYYALRPGITGSWQVSKRNESCFADRATFDASYNRDVSLGEDIRLLAATVRVVLRATGY